MSRRAGLPHGLFARRAPRGWACVAAMLATFATMVAASPPVESERTWLAGDHHVHSRYSVDWDRRESPPAPVIGGESNHPIPLNAQMASRYGLAWMASTDHGGPNHSKLNLERAYPEVLEARRAVPGLVLFYAMELNSPGADHSSLIVPHGEGEARQLYELESRFDRRDAYPEDPARNTEPKMLEALRYMDAQERKPVVIANHPARSAAGPGRYGLTSPAGLRDWNDAAPEVAVGMEGSPGYQAMTLGRDGKPGRAAARANYRRYPTLGGFDQMTARLGGMWDAFLGEGRRWWITANSDSHAHYTEGGPHFWPGEYSKTYVYAARSHDDVLDGLRTGRVFVTTGDLVSELYVTVAVGNSSAAIGGELEVASGADVRVTIRFCDPDGPNHRGDTPSVARVDLIVGQVLGRAADRNADHNPTTRVLQRFAPGQWQVDGECRVMQALLQDVREPLYLRVRGTNGGELEPAPDVAGENPWDDLWFYSNPVFVMPRRT